QHRSVRIFQPTRNTMQSGSAKTERWRIDFDILPGSARWENPLMGWASSADYMQGTRISFRSKEDAVHFAEKQGWNYFVQQPAVKRIPPKNYAENYVYKPHKLRIMRTK
ncbi:ETC complex I subunit conserved region-domain-containing protein, partial [Pholiota molesta]